MLAIITSYFNLSGDPRLYENFHQFRKQMKELPFYSVELSHDGNFETDATLKLKASENQILWHKERMLNLLAEQLPREVDSIAWIDADILFLNPDWYNKTEKALQEKSVVQLFSNAHFINDDGSFDRKFRSAGSAGGYWSRQPRPHCGFAWAMRREVWNRIGGLYDLDITGGGDAWMAHAFFRERSGKFLRYSSQAMLASFAKYHEKCWSEIQGRVGCIQGDIVHLYHGEFQDRRYWEKHQSLKECAYNPERDLKTVANGLLEWTRENPELQAKVSGLF